MPSSSTSRSASAFVGVAGVVGLLGGDDRERVHHLDRGGQDAGGDDRGHRLAGRVGRPERRQVRGHRLGLAQDAQRDLRRDPERSLRADEGAEQVGPVRIERLAAELDELAVGEHDGQPGDVVDREAVLEAVGAARVLGHVAADRADLLARGVGRVEEAVGGDGPRHVEVGDARLDHARAASRGRSRGSGSSARARSRCPRRPAARRRRGRCRRRGRRTARPRARRCGRRPAPRRSSRAGRRARASRASR